MIEYIQIEKLFASIDTHEQVVLLDVRSPVEYKQGHIPGAINLPLFDNDERALVGTMYKSAGREASVLLGLELVGSKLVGFVKIAMKLAPKRKVLIHCWRGGMRSGNMAWLLDTAGFSVKVIEGGYKAYRGFIRKQFEIKANIIIVGGHTGSGKTEIIHALHNKNEQVIDLEGIANHKGSAFGAIGMENQPTNEQFENDIYDEWKKLDLSKYVWLEDESRSVGAVSIPDPLYKQMRQSQLVKINMGKEIRIARLVKDYVTIEPDKLVVAVERIRKKLGGQWADQAIEAIKKQNYELAADILLTYYDKAYLKGQQRRPTDTIINLEVKNPDPEMIADQLISHKLISNIA